MLYILLTQGKNEKRILLILTIHCSVYRRSIGPEG